MQVQLGKLKKRKYKLHGGVIPDDVSFICNNSYKFFIYDTIIELTRMILVKERLWPYFQMKSSTLGNPGLARL